MKRIRANAAWPLAVLMYVSAAVLATTLAVGAPPASAAPGASPTSGYLPPPPENFSGLSWTEAFDALQQKMSREYAFTRWKGIDWPALAAEYRPRIAAAQATGDLGAYYLTLREFVHELPDGHVSIKAFDEPAQTEIAAAEKALAGGGFGLIATRLNTGKVIASWVKPGGPAGQAGMVPGAQLFSWDGSPVTVALTHTSTVLGPNQPTFWRTQYEQCRYLVRAPVGATRTVTYRNPAEHAHRTATLTAVDDGLETLIMTDNRSVMKNGWPERMVEHEILPGKVGYVRLYMELDLPASVPGDHTPTLTLFRTAIQEFVDAKVAGVIVDIRANAGGSDQMVTDLLASFYQRRTFYEYQNYVIPETGAFEIWLVDDDTGDFTLPGQGLWIEPAAVRYAGPVVALVNNGCISSGEGMAMGIKNLSTGRVVGFEGTNGSFGMVGAAVLMPGNFEIDWPYGQSLNKRLGVQIDSRHGQGGVTPDYRIPMTQRNALRIGAGEDVVLDYGLRVLRTMRRSN